MRQCEIQCTESQSCAQEDKIDPRTIPSKTQNSELTEKDQAGKTEHQETMLEAERERERESETAEQMKSVGDLGVS